MTRFRTHLMLIVVFLLVGAKASLAKCTICVNSNGKCFTFSNYSCKEVLANCQACTGTTSCTDALAVKTGTTAKGGGTAKGSATVTGISLPLEAAGNATMALTQARVAFFEAKGSDPSQALIIILNEPTPNGASEALRRSSITFKLESVPEESVQPAAMRAVSTKGISGSRSEPPPVPAAAAGVVNSSRSNIKNNLAVADPSGPLSVTGVTCNGTSSVSLTTNYAAPTTSTYVIASPSRKTISFPAERVTSDANGRLQIPFDASSGTYTLDIQNANGISILPKPLPVINCAPR